MMERAASSRLYFVLMHYQLLEKTVWCDMDFPAVEFLNVVGRYHRESGISCVHGPVVLAQSVPEL